MLFRSVSQSRYLDALLPFQINLPVNKPAPIAWEISTVCGKNVIDITNNLKEVKIYSFEGKKQAVYLEKSHCGLNMETEMKI